MSPQTRKGKCQPDPIIIELPQQNPIMEDNKITISVDALLSIVSKIMRENQLKILILSHSIIR